MASRLVNQAYRLAHIGKINSTIGELSRREFFRLVMRQYAKATKQTVVLEPKK